MNQARPQNKPPCGLVGSGSTSEPSPGSSVGLLVVSSSRSSIPRTTSALRRGHGPGMGRENKTHPRPVRRGERTLRAACSARVRAYDRVTKCSSWSTQQHSPGSGPVSARTRQDPARSRRDARRDRSGKRRAAESLNDGERAWGEPSRRRAVRMTGRARVKPTSAPGGGLAARRAWLGRISDLSLSKRICLRLSLGL